MKKWIFLSYLLNEKTPVYGNGQSFQSEIMYSMKKGDSCNSEKWVFSNHTGTHIDCPFHFSINGKKINDYPPSFWIFIKTHCVDISPVSPGAIIDNHQLPLKQIPSDTELLLIKSGFCYHRNKSIYWNQNPGLSPELFSIFRKKFTSLRAIGFDMISISSWQNRPLGRIAHRAFLDTEDAILLIEDMDLSAISSETVFTQVIVSPLMRQHADASPCTIIGRIH